MFRKRDTKDEKPSEEARYGDELLSANWNPVVDLLARSSETTRDRVSRAESDRDLDTDGFLNRVYTLGA